MQNLQTKVKRPVFCAPLAIWAPTSNQVSHCLLYSDQVCRLQIDEKQNQLSAARKQLKAAKADHKASHDDKSKK